MSVSRKISMAAGGGGGTDIELVGVVLDKETSTVTSWSLSLASIDWVADDLLVVIESCDEGGGGTISPTTSTLETTLSTSPYLRISLRTLTGGDSDTVSCSGMNSSSAVNVIAFVLRNAEYVSGVAVANAGTGNPDCPSLTATIVDTDWIIAVGALDDDDVTFGMPANYTVIGQQGCTAGPSATSLVAAYRTGLTAASENPGAFTGSGNDGWRAATFRITNTG